MILFSRNWESRHQLMELTTEAKALRPDLLICVDHEGGRVQRFRSDGIVHLAPMSTLGNKWDQAPMEASRAATACGYVLAAQLRACGVDFSFTPVLDLNWGASSVIGDRAFHERPLAVTQLAKSLLHGMLLAGMNGCGKHFPGHGWASADSHVTIPIDRRGLERIRRHDLEPYDWLSSALPAVMTAHVIYPRVDGLPATYSKRWIKDVLRDQLNFSGTVISDDLSMAGARQVEKRELTHGEAILMALEAGCDLALLCNQSLNGGLALDNALDELTKAQAKRRWHPSPASEQRRRALLPASVATTWDELMSQARYQQALSLYFDCASDHIK
jgi:beta-N-acetylhexosaminidase